MHKNNITRLDDNYHESLHAVFGNRIPHEQLLSLLKLNQSTFKPAFVEQLMILLTGDPASIYNPEVMRKGTMARIRKNVHDDVMDILDSLE